MKASTARYFLMGLASATICIVVFMVYGDMLAYWFTTADSLTLIDTARITSAADVTRLLTERLMAGTSFASNYFRPVSALSFSLDYALWGLDPRGYHLTDLAYHLLATQLVFLVTWRLSQRNLIHAWLAALVFTLHPVLSNSVPGIARRQDVIMVVWILLALLCFMFAQERHRRRWALLGVLCYLLAIHAKELAYGFPALIFVYAVIYPQSEARSRWRGATTAALPYFGVSVIAYLWRSHVLAGAESQFIPLSDLLTREFWVQSRELLQEYAAFLLYPDSAPETLLGTVSTHFLFVDLPVLVLLATIGVDVWSRVSGHAAGPSRRGYYFMLVWVIEPFCVMRLTQNLTSRCMYCSVIPLSYVLSGAVLDSLNRLVSGLRALKNGDIQLNVSGPAVALVRVSTLVVGVLVIGWLIAFSPLFQPCDSWELPARLAGNMLIELEAGADSWGTADHVIIQNWPSNYMFLFTAQYACGKSASAPLIDYAVESWLHLNDHPVAVKIEGEHKLIDDLRNFQIVVVEQNADTVVLRVEYG